MALALILAGVIVVQLAMLAGLIVLARRTAGTGSFGLSEEEAEAEAYLTNTVERLLQDLQQSAGPGDGGSGGATGGAGGAAVAGGAASAVVGGGGADGTSGGRRARSGGRAGGEAGERLGGGGGAAGR